MGSYFQCLFFHLRSLFFFLFCFLRFYQGYCCGIIAKTIYCEILDLSKAASFNLKRVRIFAGIWMLFNFLAFLGIQTGTKTLVAFVYICLLGSIFNLCEFSIYGYNRMRNVRENCFVFSETELCIDYCFVYPAAECWIQDQVLKSCLYSCTTLRTLFTYIPVVAGH